MAPIGIKDCPSSISIFGSGEFARALATRLNDVGTYVVVGSRFPSRRRDVPPNDILSKVKVTSLQESASTSDVIVVALHPEHYTTLKPLEGILAGKILVDVSNTERAHGDRSNAEKLADLFPQSHVVKAFNTVAAFTLLTMYQDRVTFVCGDDPLARKITMQLANRIGLSAVDSGKLVASGLVEESNRKLLPGWGWPTIVTFIICVIWIIYTICRYYVMRETPYTWDRIPTNVINKMAGVTSVTLLALVYIPGSIAAFKQLANGTKHKRFHKSLDRWLKMRKQLGLYALLFGTLHTTMSMTLLSPAYYSSWFHTSQSVVPGNLTVDFEVDHTSRMNWYGETVVCLGFLAQFTMSILGMVSIPSIANSLNWREWQCLQSYMGFICLLFASAHVTVKGGKSWVDDTWKDILPSMAFTSSLLPWFAIALRLMLLTPCCYIRLNKIRRGWESRNEETVVIVVKDERNGSVEPEKMSGADNRGFVHTSF